MRSFGREFPWSDEGVQVRVVAGRERVVRELRAAAPLMADLGAPVPAGAAWLTTVLNVSAATRRRGRPVAVLVESGPLARPDGAAFLWVARRGAVLETTLLGDDAQPLPAGRPWTRLLATDDQVAARLAAGILDLAVPRRGPWRLRLSGLPMGDRTLGALGELRPDLAFTNSRSTATVDRLDALDRPVHRSRYPRTVERVLPALLATQPDRRARLMLRAAARLHAAAGQLEVAEVRDGARSRTVLLTLIDGPDSAPWVGDGDPAAFGAAMGVPSTAVEGRGGGLRDRGATR